jgi:hypothetical protein
MASSRLKRVASVVVWVVFCAVWLPYAFFRAVAPHYTFSKSAPFRGERLHNPYVSLPGRWYRANFHAHGRAWMGLTAGKDNDLDVVMAYRQQGYDVVGVSNYMQISPTSDVPVYEHGYNLGLSHQLIIGAAAVSWFDVPVATSALRQKQFVLNRVKSDDAVTVLAHPSLAQGYTEQELTALQGYAALEVVNHSRIFPEAWDAALSSGHRVWAVGNDDTHDIANPTQTFVAFTWINAASKAPRDIVNAIADGHTIAVRQNRPKAAPVNSLKDVTVSGSSYTLTLTQVFDSAQCIGDHGRQLSTAAHTESIHCQIPVEGSYARVEVTTGDETLFFNPLTRAEVTMPPLDIQWTPTLATAFAMLTQSLLFGFGALYAFRSKTTK